jgi:DNA-binding beta-propeller fold protein YncE
MGCRGEGREHVHRNGGVHQIWALDFANGWLRIHAGTGGEDIRDGPNREALLAQPMGITLSEGRLYFADAEGSAIRWTTLGQEGETGTVLGTGLFDFGNIDGIGSDVRMQHQQGIAVSSEGLLLVADSYNDALKWVDPASRSARTWIGGLNEPGGVACSVDYAYVADTNAPRILTVDYRTGASGELMLE